VPGGFQAVPPPVRDAGDSQ